MKGIKRRLGDLATYVNGYAFKPEERGNEGLPIIRIQDLTGNAYDLGFYNGKYPERVEINDGDVLISWSASLGVFVWNRGKALLNQHIFKVVFDRIKINKLYFVYAVEYKLGEMTSKTHGATMKHIIKKDFEDITIPFPSQEKQEEIAQVLSRIVSIIRTRQQELQKLDDLVKARFVEMFGDPESNNKNWPIKELSEICNIGSSKRIYQEEQSSFGVPFWRVSDLVCKIENGNVNAGLFISENKYETLKEQGFVPNQGDILVTSRGTIGKCYIIRDEDKFYFQDGMISWLRNFRNGTTPLYLQYLFQMNGFRKQIDRIQNGTTVSYLSIAMLKKLNVMIPDEVTQKQFASFVAQVDKSKFIIQEALKKTQLLYDSLMQEYFG